MIRRSPPPLWSHALAVVAFGTFYWALVAQAEGVSEPWDAALYWRAYYPVSLLVTAVVGAAFGRRHALTGFGMSLPQVFVMIPTMSEAALVPIGLGFAAALSIPAVVAAWLAAHVAARC